MVVIYDKECGGWLSFRFRAGRDISVVPYCVNKGYEYATLFKSIGSARVAIWRWLRQMRKNGSRNFDIKECYKGLYELHSHFANL